jgi:hypothetical protein
MLARTKANHHPATKGKRAPSTTRRKHHQHDLFGPDIAAIAMRIWDTAVPAYGTLTEDYLIKIGLALPANAVSTIPTKTDLNSEEQAITPGANIKVPDLIARPRKKSRCHHCGEFALIVDHCPLCGAEPPDDAELRAKIRAYFPGETDEQIEQHLRIEHRYANKAGAWLPRGHRSKRPP